ncbi:MspA family porin [Nocardia amikacinitolerans]|uniref:MspA family porin n=1 Tax=Nocardia amikacinitolerans TaxID=756689 RepID=UPI001470C14B|nr:MspA family porin [Nocardia amikacinitolerans]
MMTSKHVLITAALCTLGAVTVAPLPSAEAAEPHERNYRIDGGPEYSVGQRDTVTRLMPALNGMPTNRELMVDSTFYGRVEDSAAGTLKAGYLVACVMEAEPKANADAEGTVEGNGEVGVNVDPDEVTPSLDVKLKPSVSGGVGVEISLTPGKIADVGSGSKDLRGGSRGSLVNRDFYIQVSGCAGPLLVRPYAKTEVHSPDVDASGAVFGDPIIL